MRKILDWLPSCTEYIDPDKALFFNQKLLLFFLFLNKYLCCGYSLEAPWWGISNEYHTTFLWRNKKNVISISLIWSCEKYLLFTHKEMLILHTLPIVCFVLSFLPKILGHLIILFPSFVVDVANSADPDQMPLLWHLIWVYTVCSGLSVRLLGKYDGTNSLVALTFW